MPRFWPWSGGAPPDDEEHNELEQQMSPDPSAEGHNYELPDIPIDEVKRQEKRASRQSKPRLPKLGQKLVVVNTTGPQGRATGIATTEDAIAGAILGIHLQYHPGAPTATDVRIYARSERGERRELLVVPETSHDGYYAPDAEPLWRPMPTTFSFVPFHVHSPIEVVVTDTDELQAAVRARIIYEAASARG